MFLLIVSTLLLTVADSHLDRNVVYAELLNEGIAIGKGKVKFPAPIMPDGLSAEEQRAAIETVRPEAYSYEKLMRDSTVAPHMMTIPDLVEAGDMRYRKADFSFIAYGELDTLTDESVLQQMLDPNKEEGDGSEIPADVLEKFGAVIDPKNKEFEGYGHVNFLLEKKVDLSLTGRGFWSRTDESIVTTMVVDPRFNSGDLANVWRPMKRDESGQLKAGDPQPYSGMAVYMKVTELKGIEDGLFVEAHLIFNEPQEWFDGQNYLASKLPPIISKQVRTMRAELKKASK